MKSWEPSGKNPPFASCPLGEKAWPRQPAQSSPVPDMPWSWGVGGWGHNHEPRHLEVLFTATVWLAQIPGGCPSPSLYLGLSYSRSVGVECSQAATQAQRTRCGSSATLLLNSSKSGLPTLLRMGHRKSSGHSQGAGDFVLCLESLRQHQTQI